MERLRTYLKPALGALLGAVIGYAYYYFVGCKSGSCAISSNPVNSAAYFAVVGLIFFWDFPKSKDAKQDQG
jgi:hypothetical protein